MARTTNPLAGAMLTDMYQITMCYAYWKNGRHDSVAVFDLFFRKNPFQGEYTIFAGLSEALAIISSFKFEEEDVNYLRKELLSDCDPAFFDWLLSVDCSKVHVRAQAEGSVVFPRVPLLTLEGPLAIVQMLETPLLNAINFPSLIATNASRYKMAAGKATLLEFGLRRAQGPDGGLSASRYAVMGGFEGTSNVLAGRLFNIPVRGTHAHAYVQTYSSLREAEGTVIGGRDIFSLAVSYRERLGFTTNDGELAAFISYAGAFPGGFLALVDTYDPLVSGVPNFICVALALDDLQFRAVGIRLDSGDLAYQSMQARLMLKDVSGKLQRPWLEHITIAASNDINEQVLLSLADHGHSIDVFGIGTHLVTCQSQPALGCVYKLVSINEQPRIKLSNSVAKVSIPGKKTAYRLFGKDGKALMDVLTQDSDAQPATGEPILCRHPFEASLRAFVVPSRVECLHSLVWDGNRILRGGQRVTELRENVKESMALIRQDVMRLSGPNPYKVSVNSELYNWLHQLWDDELPIRELS